MSGTGPAELGPYQELCKWYEDVNDFDDHYRWNVLMPGKIWEIWLGAFERNLKPDCRIGFPSCTTIRLGKNISSC